MTDLNFIDLILSQYFMLIYGFFIDNTFGVIFLFFGAFLIGSIFSLISKK